MGKLIKYITLAVILTAFPFVLFSQTNTWTGSVNVNWNTAGNWSLNLVPTSAHDVVIPNNFSVTVNTDAVCNSFTINSGANANTITVSGTNSLTVTNAITIGAGTGNGDHKIISVGTGSLAAGSVTVSATGNANRNSGITLSSGTVTIGGNITMGDANDVITFTGAGVLYIGGTMTGGTFTPSTGTVNCNASGGQNIGSYTYYNLTLSGSGTKSLTGTTTVNGTYTNNEAAITLATGANNLTFNGPVTNSGLLTAGNNTVTYGGTGSQTIIPANYNNLTISGARTVNTFTFTGITGIAGTFSATATFTSGGYSVSGSTVDFNGDAAQNIPAFTYFNLSVSNKNGASVTARTKTQQGIIVVNGDLYVIGYSASVTTLQLGNFNLTVNGTTTVDAYGNIADNNGQTNLFSGPVIITANGRWNVPQPCTFRNGLNVSSTNFVSGSTYTFDTNPQTIEGTTAFTLPSISLGTAGINVVNTNINGTTISGTISGAGNLVNGNASNNALLVLTYAGDPFTLTGSTDFTTNPNIVRFTSASGQTIDSRDYYDLSITGARTTNSVTFLNGGTIRIYSSFSPSSTFTSGNYVTTGSTLEFNGTSPQTIPAINTASYNNLTVSGGGLKTLSANISLSASGVLNLNGSVIELSSFNLTVANNASTAITNGSAYGQTNMISTGGTGYLQKNGTAAGNFQIVYPVGSGGYYSPMTISSIGTLTPTYIRVRAVPTALNPNFILKYWDVSSNISLNNTTATFNYDAAEGNGASQDISYSPDGGATWQNPPTNGVPSFGANSFTITGSNPFTGWWTMGLNKYFYSYQSGFWDEPTTWTTDPSGTLQIGTTVPGTNDNVIILSGRTVSLQSNVTSFSLDITLSDGAFIDLAGFSFSNGLKALRGQGTLQLSSASFPVAITNTFVNSGGGTTEYRGAVNLPVAQTTYNNLKINTSGSVVQLNNLVLNGNLDVVQGTFQINNNTAARRQLTINGNVNISSTGSITVGTGVTNTVTNPVGIATTVAAPFINYYDSHSHRVVIFGDFVNNGTVRFTNLDFPVYNQFPPTVAGTTTGFATVYFRGTTNNVLTCNGITDFYNIVIDKGTDQTYSLTVNSSGYSNFRLFGANIAGGDISMGATAANPNLKKALWVRTGTLVLEGEVVIPSLSEGNNAAAAPYINYIIPYNAAIKINGADVIVQSTADLYEEVNVAYGVNGGTGLTNGVITGADESGILISGKLEVNGGFLSTKESRGLLYNSTITGQIFINGGKVDAKQLRSLTAGTGLLAYYQTGGTLELRGRFQRTPSVYNVPGDLADAAINTIRLNDASLLSTAGSFSIENVNDLFNMSGGSINVYDVPVTGASARVFDILTSSSNIKVTGGTVGIYPTAGTGGSADASTWLVSSVASLNNFIINSSGSTSVVQLNTGYPLVLAGSFALQSGEFNANSLNVSVGGDFLIETGTIYTTGTNTTILNGSAEQTLTVNLATPLNLANLRIDKPAGVILTLAGSQSQVNISGSLLLYTATVSDGGKQLNVSGNIYNSGTLNGTGTLVLNGTGTQTIDGSGSGIFNNINLDNTNAASAPVSLLNNIFMTGTLTFSQDKLFNIGKYSIELAASASISGANQSRYIVTTGALGDGGLIKNFNTPGSFIYPVGVSNFTPATVTLNGVPDSYGSVTVIPVNYSHPAITTSGRSLTYFWRLKSSALVLGAATATLGFTYNDANVVTGAGITEDEYVAARYNSVLYSWTSGSAADVDEGLNIIGEPGTGTFLESVSFIDGDYTAGDNSPVNPFGTPIKFYSRQNGQWGSTSTWSLTGHTVDNPPAAPPGANDIVIIGNGNFVTFATPAGYLTNPNTDPHSCASLQIETGSNLDIRFNPSSIFGMVQSHPSGNGTIRIACDYDDGSTFAFPGGDFSDFNTNLGTTELYSTNSNSGTTYWLPNGVTSYGNLIISPLGGSNIIFPNNDLLILGNLIMRGQNADSWFCPTWSTNYPTAPAVRISKTITVRGDFDIQGGSFGWYGGGGGGAQNIVIDGDVIVAPGAGIDVWSSNTSQGMSIGGSLINNTTNSTAPGVGTVSYVNLTNVVTTFFGNTNASVTNTTGTPRTVFGTVIVNKGNSQATTLTIDVSNILTTPVNAWLTLQNGTLRYMRNNPAAGANFTISTTTPFVIPATAGLYVDYPNANNVNILIGNASNNSGDLQLSGKLTILRGNVYVGPVSAPDNNNDIEYTGSGSSEIDVQGGVLVVNGNIKRQGTSEGILKYSQSGTSSVTINGRGSLVTNAKLEILNSGSIFNMSGNSTLTFLRGGGTSIYGDIYIRPEVSSVTGGTIIIAPVLNVTAAEETFKTDINIPVNNLTVTGFGATDAARVSLSVNNLVLKGDLTISNSNSFLTTNNLNVTIGGNMTNSGTYSYGINTTTFNGNIQNINGSTVTNFGNLIVSPVSSLTVNSNFTVNGNLTINSGTLSLLTYRLSLLGNVINNGAFTDDNITGGLYLNGTTLQLISGSGSFGRLQLDNALGAKALTDLTFQNNIVLTTGNFEIGSNQLTLGVYSSFSGAPYSITKMIITDGVTSSLGIRKFYNIIAAPTSFEYPIGVSGKYTPVTLSVDANATVGFVLIKPINGNHPGVLDPNNVLDYYWAVESSGISSFQGSATFTYMPEDVKGTESNYIAARLLVPGTMWSKATPGPGTDNVNEVSHTVYFPIPSGTNNLSGDYTAGIDTAIPDEVPIYTSINDGDWSDENIWAPVGLAPPCPNGGPNGFIVVINHNVRTDISYCFAYKTTINNKLTIESSTIGHNLGLVDGSGTLLLKGGNLPAGNFTTFLSCAGSGVLEYSGSGTYTIIATQFNTVNKLFFTGTGSRILPNKDLTICNRLVIDGPTLDNSISNKGLIIKGTIERYNTGSFVSGTGSGAYVSFQGSALQNLGGALGDFNGSNSFNNLEVNNINGLSINAGSIELTGSLLLTNGIINTSSSNRLIITNTASNCVLPSGGSSTSFVNGPLTKNIPSASAFIFPIGSGSVKGHTITVTAGTGSTVQWTATYNRPNPTSGSYNSPLQVINESEFWTLSSSSAKKATVKIAWDIYSTLTPLMTQNGISDMRVSEYSGGFWQELSSVTSGDNNYGDVATASLVNISTSGNYFTTASITSTKPRASLNPSGPVCGNSGIPVSFTSSAPIPLNYTLTYSLNGVVQPAVNITTLPYTLPTPVSGLYKLTAFTYNNGSSNGVVDPTPVNAYDNPTTSVAGDDQSLCGVSGANLAGNDPAPYSGLWSVVSGTGGTFLNANQYNTPFTGSLGETYTLRWTISNFSCTSSDDVIISFPVVAAQPSNFTAAPNPVCQGSTGNLYSVINVSGQTYNWTYSGLDYTISGSGNQVTIDFGPAATSGILSVTATNSCGTSPARTLNLTVTTLPVATFDYTGSPYCKNAGIILPNFTGGGIAGTFSSTPGLVFSNVSTGEINVSLSTPGTYTVTNTIAPAGGCGIVTATNSLSITNNNAWTGNLSTDWNTLLNWSCGYIPEQVTLVNIPDVPNKPLLSVGAIGMVNNLTVEANASLTISGNKLQVAGSITNNGTLVANNGTIEFNGNSPQTIAAGTFSGNAIKDLIINNASGVSILGSLDVSGILLLQNGNLASDGYLTLTSSAAGTALIDGSGSGQVTGLVNMQRYIPAKFGYRYISSPFQAATVSELGDDINLGASFPSVYRYDENRISSGWVSYITPTNVLNPMQGYSVNFLSSPVISYTFDITGIVNNSPVSLTLYNNNRTYTKGFNLVGNPYPSPIDWDAASGWTKTNIDDAVYYFKPSATDQYGGTYSSYVNGISSDGIANNIIPSMQGFFVHVSDGAYPVTGTLGIDNNARVTSLNPVYFKSAKAGVTDLVRIVVSFTDDPAFTDAAVIYFNDKATDEMDSRLDALKLLNTDLSKPNIYSITPAAAKLSVSALPPKTGTISVPLGVKVNRDGTAVIRLKDIDPLLTSGGVYLKDVVTGTQQDLLGTGKYTIYLPKGEYLNRFYLEIGSMPTSDNSEAVNEEKLFDAYTIGENIKSTVFKLNDGKGKFVLYALTGQILFTNDIFETGFYEFSTGVKPGVYILTLTTGNIKYSKKLFIRGK